MDHNDDRSETTSEDTRHSVQPPDEGDVVPSVSCSMCGQEWELAYELDELHVGNRAVEQFALDHYRHTGHYPDDVSPWVVSCRQCPAEEQYLEQRPARRFGETHARHTSHTVVLTGPDDGSEQRIDARSVSQLRSSQPDGTE